MLIDSMKILLIYLNNYKNQIESIELIEINKIKIIKINFLRYHIKNKITIHLRIIKKVKIIIKEDQYSPEIIINF